MGTEDLRALAADGGSPTRRARRRSGSLDSWIATRSPSPGAPARMRRAAGWHGSRRWSAVRAGWVLVDVTIVGDEVTGGAVGSVGVPAPGSAVVDVGAELVVAGERDGGVGPGVEPAAPVDVPSVASIADVPSSPSPARPASATTRPMIITAATPAAASLRQRRLRRPEGPPGAWSDPDIGTPPASRAAAALDLSNGGARAIGTMANRRSGARTSSRSAAHASQSGACWPMARAASAQNR
jgi:hypothetical protein